MESLEQLQAEVKRLSGEIAAERELRLKTEQAALERERAGLISESLARHGVRGPAAEDATRFFRDETLVDEGGGFTSRGGVPLAAFIESTLKGSKKHWLPGNNAAAARERGTEFDLDNIRPGMSKEEEARATRAILTIQGRNR